MESVFYIWHRDIIKLGGAIKNLMNTGGTAGALAGFDFVKFMFPGIIGMTVFTTAIFSALSIVQDREFGFMKEILVSPVPRFSVALGKSLGGATVAMMQGILMFVFVPFIGLKLTPAIMVKIIPAMFLVSFAISSIGILIASRSNQLRASR